MNPKQSKMARAGLKWTRDELSKRCGVSVVTVSHFESGYYIKKETVDKIRNAFEDGGVEFLQKSDRIYVSIPVDSKADLVVKKYINNSMRLRTKGGVKN